MPLLALLQTACVPIPFVVPARDLDMRQDIGQPLPVRIEPGQTTMADVILALGQPHTATTDSSQASLTWVSGHTGGGLGIVLFGQAAATVAAVRGVTYRRLIVIFASDGTVAASRYDERACTDRVLGMIVGHDPDPDWEKCISNDWARGLVE
ncbi:MAG: hypothetical protein JSR21_13410 [Proteobacteria bacterium]|nr:hypothetical protein [Pseudomonadota bacterium]